MKCFACAEFSFEYICSNCQRLFLQPSIHKRRLSNGTEVISFYKYDDIKKLLHTKHTPAGYYIYKILANNSLKLFAKNFKFPNNINSIAVDDNVKSDYSHTAILNHALKSKIIQPLHNKLRATNSISYSGKTKEYRLLHPRNFSFNGLAVLDDIILVDDIITTGLTLSQAVECVKRENREVLFCLTLADVKS